MPLNTFTVAEAAAGLRRRDFSAHELAERCLEAIQKRNGDLNAYLTITADEALEAATAADRRLAAGDAPALCGIPVAIKDIFCTRGVRTTSASKILENYIPPYDATAVAKLRAQGMVMVGKTNLDEFAMGGSTENSAYGPTRNPYDLERVAGGSSGGSAAAVAADLCLYALGTDTGGSIRQPASYCGTSGLKVTYGRVSRSGAMAMTSSLDTIGPFAKSVEDIATILGAIAGHDEYDSTTPPEPVPNYAEAITQDIKGLKIGLPKEYFIEGIDDGVRELVLAAAKQLEALGAEIVDISLPHTESALAAYYIICPSEVSSNLARYDGIRYGHSHAERGDLATIYKQSRADGLGAEVKRRIMIGTYALSAGYYDAYYKKAMQVRTLICRDFDAAFESVDAILTPVAPTPAFKIGENANDPLKMYLADIFTIPASLAGICGLSIPAGLSNGLPVGIQLLGKRFAESTILNIGHQYQQVTEFHKTKPQA